MSSGFSNLGTTYVTAVLEAGQTLDFTNPSIFGQPINLLAIVSLEDGTSIRINQGPKYDMVSGEQFLLVNVIEIFRIICISGKVKIFAAIVPKNIPSVFSSRGANGTDMFNALLAAFGQYDVAKDSTSQEIYSTLSALKSFLEGRLDVDLSTRASEETVRKIDAMEYDFTIRRNAGRMLATVDFTINPSTIGLSEEDLGIIRIEGASSAEVVEWSSENIPQPETDGSPYVMKLTIAAGSTAYVRVPIKCGYWKPFAAYIALYAKDYDVNVLPYVVLGGVLSEYRNKLPKYLKLPANNWGRFMVHWFMEAHHGCAEIVVEINNPQSSDVTVYIGIVTAGEIDPFIKGFGMVFGWEDVFELDISNETLDFYIDVIVPSNAGKVVHMLVTTGVAGDGTNTASLSVGIAPWRGASSVNILSLSTSSTTPSVEDVRFSVLLGRKAPYDYQTVSVYVSASTSGAAKITELRIVVFGFSDEYRYSEGIDTEVDPGETQTIIDLSGSTKHVCGGVLYVSAPSDGSVSIYGDGELIEFVPKGVSREVRIDGRYHKIEISNSSSTTSAAVCGHITVSNSLLL